MVETTKKEIMEPITFDEVNVVHGGPDYIDLPAWVDIFGRSISCYKLTDEEIIKIWKTKVMWVDIMTFKNPLQPLMLHSDYPFVRKEPEIVVKKKKRTIRIRLIFGSLFIHNTEQEDIPMNTKFSIHWNNKKGTVRLFSIV